MGELDVDGEVLIGDLNDIYYYIRVYIRKLKVKKKLLGRARRRWGSINRGS